MSCPCAILLAMSAATAKGSTYASVPAKRVDNVPVYSEMSDSFLAYALSVITSRAIPDARDGLKPVQRRVLWAMLRMGIRPGTPFRKSARIVGDTMGRYHPHGDAAIYDTLVRMGQDFSRMVPLVEPQGNFGSLDDPPAAARYTECRLSASAMDVLGELDESTVDFVPTYDGEAEEPTVLAGALPNFLVNGSSGIAVGMSTNTLSHNLGEVAAAIDLVMREQTGRKATRRTPRPTTDELMKVLPGPDFPGGGIVVADAGLRAIYETGRGAARVRATVTLEPAKRPRSIIVTELPPQIGPEKIVARVSELITDGRLPGVSGIADLSDLDGLRLRINLRASTDHKSVLEDLYKLTPLEDTTSVNTVALVDGVPTTLSLRDLCEHYIAHRIEVVVRRTQHRLGKAQVRLHLVEGLLTALSNLDAVVTIIRKAADAAKAQQALMRRFKLTEAQAEHILDLTLRRLTALERLKLEDEEAKLRSSIAEYEAILASGIKQRNLVKRELQAAVDRHATPRRALIVSEDALSKATTTRAATVAASPSSASLSLNGEMHKVTVSSSGNIGRLPVKATKRGTTGRHDLLVSSCAVSAVSSLVAITSNGRAIPFSLGDVPPANNRIRGAAGSDLLSLESKEEVLALITSGATPILLVSNLGRGKRVSADEIADVRNRTASFKMADGERLVAALPVADKDHVVVIASDGKASRFPGESVPVKGLAHASVALFTLGADATVVGAGAVTDKSTIAIGTTDGGMKKMLASEMPIRGRGGKGVFVCRLSQQERISAAYVGNAKKILALVASPDDHKRLERAPTALNKLKMSTRTSAPERGASPVRALAPSRW